MKTLFKKSQLLILVALLTFLTSCVYSLFPIYTKDTLVFKPELLGKWQSGDDYILFERYEQVEKEKEMKKEKKSYAYKIEGENLKIESDDPITMKVNGKVLTDEKEIIKYMGNEYSNENKDEKIEISSTSETITTFKDSDKFDFNVGVVEHFEESYLMTVINESESDIREKYIVHLIEIGEDLFIDLYPLVNHYSSGGLGDNLMPVHSFMKLELSGNKMNMVSFDLDKLNKLFESNLIRLRHENVDGTILITAQPEELQKFLEKYSKDESVYDESSSYSKVAS